MKTCRTISFDAILFAQHFTDGTSDDLLAGISPLLHPNIKMASLGKAHPHCDHHFQLPMRVSSLVAIGDEWWQPQALVAE